MIREILTESWSLKKRWILFTGGLCLLMLVYHGSAVVESTYISDVYWSYKISPPPKADRLVEDAASDLIKKINVSVNELRDTNIDEYQMVYSNVIEHDGPSYIEYIYMDMRNCILSEDVGFYEKKICLMNEYAIEKEMPSSYDFDIYTELHYGNNDYVPYYGRSNYPGDDSGSGISVGLPFSVIESDKLYKGYLNQMELRWLKTQGEKEIWRRVQERFQWD